MTTHSQYTAVPDYDDDQYDDDLLDYDAELLKELEAALEADRLEDKAALAPMREHARRRHGAARRNAVRRFLSDRYAADPAGRVKAGPLFAEYQRAALDGRLLALDLRQFPQTLAELGIASKVTKHGRVWLGIRERDPGDVALYSADDFEPEPLDFVRRSGLHERGRWYNAAACIYQHAKRLRRNEVNDFAHRLACGSVPDTAENEWPSGQLLDICIRTGVILDGKPVWSCVTDDELRELRSLRRRAHAIMKPNRFPDFSIVFDPSDLPALPAKVRPLALGAGTTAVPSALTGFVVDVNDRTARPYVGF